MAATLPDEGVEVGVGVGVGGVSMVVAVVQTERVE